MGKNYTPNGRSRKLPKHVRQYEWMLKTEAYRSLGPYARCLLIEFCRKYDGHNNGYISMSIREAQALINCGRKCVEKGLKQLEDRGFIIKKTQGVFISGMASEWALTEFEIGTQSATKDFMRWRLKTENTAPKVHG